MRLTAPQIAAYARSAGFTGANVAIAVAVALAESGGDTTAVNRANSDGSVDRGLWQINSVHADLLSKYRWDDPADNAKMAYSVWKSQGWHGWTTYNNGDYAKHIGEGNSAAATNVAVAATSGKQYGGPNQPPYDPHTLVGKKLTAIQRQRIVAFCVLESTVLHTKDPSNKRYTAPDLAKMNDADLITLYAMLDLFWQGDHKPITGPGGDLPSWVKVLGDLVSFITDVHNWERLAMFLVGSALVLFASYKLSGASLPKVVPV